MKNINLLIEAVAIESAGYSDKEKAELLIKIATKINSAEKDKVLQTSIPFEEDLNVESFKTLSSFTDAELEQKIISALQEKELSKVEIIKKMKLTPGTRNQKRFNSILFGLKELGIITHNLKRGLGSKFRLVNIKWVDKKPI